MDGHAVIVGRLPGVQLPDPAAGETPDPPAVRSRRMRVLHKIGQILINIAFLGVVGCVMAMLVPAVLGFQRFVILTGSMTGTYDRGSIVYDRAVPTSQLKVGDPITYNPPPGFTSQTRVTHRIWYIHRGPNGERVFKTKGDANQHPDAWKFTLTQPTQDKVVFHVPEVGYVFLLLSLRDFRIALVGVPALIIGLILLRRLWREGGEAARRQRLAEQGWRAVAPPGFGAVLPPLDGAPATVQVPSRLDLHLRPIRTSSASAAARQHAAPRIRVDLTRPLRIGRLTSALASGAHADTRGSPLNDEPLRPDASLATIRLVVGFGAVPVRHRSPVPSAE